MKPLQLIAIVLLVAGAAALAFGNFNYTRDTTALKVGPLELSVKEKQTVNLPTWLGIGGIAAGVLLLVWGSKNKR